MQSIRLTIFAFLVLVIALMTLPGLAHAQNLRKQNLTKQSLIKRYQWSRTQELARISFNESGRRLAALDLEVFVTPTDSTRMWLESKAGKKQHKPDQDTNRFVIDRWHAVDPAQERRFMALFDDTDWAFIGATSRQHVDTTRTRELRARMQAHFGNPTRTLADLAPVENLTRDQLVEFEYWIAVNDSIPVIILDTNGPWDRGVVFASASVYRSQLAEIKAELLGQLIRSDQRSPFADYYYNPEQDQWYITGFDGTTFYDARIGPPDLDRGRPRGSATQFLPGATFN